MEDRVEFCQWFLAQPEDFAQRVIWFSTSASGATCKTRSTESSRKTIEKLMDAVVDIAETIPEEMLRNAAANARVRADACLRASGGHFEHFL